MEFFRDTIPAMLKLYFERLRAMKDEERSRLAEELSEGIRQTAADGVRARHPEYDEESVRMAVARLTIGETEFKRFFPWCEIKP